ncbi:MAG: Phosphoglycerate mutase [Hydrocarboniphaga sp.]|uniref:histidine phosphatase family protein n=1 Tax=Hydrocarboniphaga sp. TaxID=2033016 RepID=UPI002630CF8C|nr:histidine phosphatase family protein [Hydrocarboniphaga sp.]MDB5968977.1 Phosphoglycerate mutase [Hydrocarboniphaga sp.]
MPRFYLVRHGSVSAPADSDTDPDLDPAGRAQALAVADQLALRLPAMLPLLCSPLRRCRQTVAPLAALWNTAPRIEAAAIEFPSPVSDRLSRTQWLQRVLPGTWAQAALNGESWEPGYAARLDRWRQGLRELLTSLDSDCVVFTHFVAINSLHGLAGGGECLSGYRPDNASVTVFDCRDGLLRLLEPGRQKPTVVG